MSDKRSGSTEPDRGKNQRRFGERYGAAAEPADEVQPETKRSGRKGASNVGQDETSGSE